MRAVVSIMLAGLFQLVMIGPSPAGETVRVRITSLAFVPADIQVRLGDTVEWVNEDFIDHTATAQSEAWDVAIPAEKSGRLQLTTAGTFSYYCRIHPGMTGTIHVVTQ